MFFKTVKPGADGAVGERVAKSGVFIGKGAFTHLPNTCLNTIAWGIVNGAKHA